MDEEQEGDTTEALQNGDTGAFAAGSGIAGTLVQRRGRGIAGARMARHGSEKEQGEAKGTNLHHDNPRRAWSVPATNQKVDQAFQKDERSWGSCSTIATAERREFCRRWGTRGVPGYTRGG